MDIVKAISDMTRKNFIIPEKAQESKDHHFVPDKNYCHRGLPGFLVSAEHQRHHGRKNR